MVLLAVHIHDSFLAFCGTLLCIHVYFNSHKMYVIPKSDVSRCADLCSERF